MVAVVSIGRSKIEGGSYELKGQSPNDNEDPLAIPAKKEEQSLPAEQTTPASVRRHDPEAHPHNSAPDPTGRRKFDRKDIKLDVSLFSDSNFYAGFTENLSAGGVFVATHNILKIGETIDVTITLPNDKQVTAHGVVRWIREYNESSDAPPGLGIQFLRIEGEGLIQDFLEARSPLFHDDDL